MPAATSGRFTKVGAPTISGYLRVGATLTAIPGTWDTGVTFHYQWYANSSAIRGATARTLVLAESRQNARISVKVTGTKTGYTSVAKLSAQTLRVMLAPTPTLSGSARYGQKLAAALGSWTPGVTRKYQWFADNVPIPGATSSAFTVTTSEQGKILYLRITGARPGYATVNVYSAKTATVNLMVTSSRSSVASAYRSILAPLLTVPTGWTGTTSSCTVGTESAASQLATLKAVNFIRALNQLDGVRFSSTWNSNALRNSLMMQARNQITHHPSKSGACWSQIAATTASQSDLALGWGYPTSVNPVTGPRAIVDYMEDPGSSNFVAGHRRWIINPLTTLMGTGSTTLANTLTVMDANGPVTSPYNAQPTWMEWPSAGYFPRQLEPGGLWSLSASSQDVDFSTATVRVVAASTHKALRVSTYPVFDGYGPNTLTWQVSGVVLPTGSGTSSYTVTVSGIKGASVSSYSYSVVMFDPNG